MAKVPSAAAPTGFAALDPSLQTALIGAGVGGLGGLLGGRNRMRDALLYAALGAGLGGGGRYLYEHGGEMFAPAGKKEREQPAAAQPAGDMSGIGRRLLGYGAGGAAGGLVQRRRLQRARQTARTRRRKMPTKGRYGRGIATGAALSALLDYLTRTSSPLRG